MLNFKKSHKGVVVLSVIVAILMCSFSLVYALSLGSKDVYEKAGAQDTVTAHDHEDCDDADEPETATVPKHYSEICSITTKHEDCPLIRHEDSETCMCFTCSSVTKHDYLGEIHDPGKCYTCKRAKANEYYHKERTYEIIKADSLAEAKQLVKYLGLDLPYTGTQGRVISRWDDEMQAYVATGWELDYYIFGSQEDYENRFGTADERIDMMDPKNQVTPEEN